MASLFIGHAAQKSKLHNLQYGEGVNHMAETETETENVTGNKSCKYSREVTASPKENIGAWSMNSYLHVWWLSE